MAAFRLDVTYQSGDHLEFFVRYADGADALITYASAVLNIRRGPSAPPVVQLSTASGGIQNGTFGPFVGTDGVSRSYNAKVVLDSVNGNLLPLATLEWELVVTDSLGHETTFLAGSWRTGSVPTGFYGQTSLVVGTSQVAAAVIGVVGPAGATGPAGPSTDTRPILLANGQFQQVAGSPVVTAVGASREAGWGLGQSESVTAAIEIPAAWTTIKVTLRWTNPGAGSGDVRWTVYLHTIADGASLSASPTPLHDAAITAPAQNVLKTSVLNVSLAVASTTGGRWLRVLRGTTGDTLGNDAVVLAVLVEKV